MTDDTVISHAEALAEIKRLRHQVELLECSIETLVTKQGLRGLEARIEAMRDNEAIAAREADRHISRMQTRITELEAELALAHGTLAKPTPDDDQPDIVHNVPPNAPPHNE